MPALSRRTDGAATRPHADHLHAEVAHVFFRSAGVPPAQAHERAGRPRSGRTTRHWTCLREAQSARRSCDSLTQTRQARSPSATGRPTTSPRCPPSRSARSPTFGSTIGGDAIGAAVSTSRRPPRGASPCRRASNTRRTARNLASSPRSSAFSAPTLNGGASRRRSACRYPYLDKPSCHGQSVTASP